MKFALINIDWQAPISKENYKFHFTMPPLDLVLLKNIANQAGHEARVFDAFVDRTQNEDEICLWADWVVLTTTPFIMWQCPDINWALVATKIEMLPKEKTVLIGLHPSVFPEQVLRQTGVHAVLRREAEGIFAEFLKTKDWLKCGGVSYLKNDQYFENPYGSLMPMDELVVHDYGLDLSRYGYFLLGKNTGIFESSRGCPWRCTFCDQEMNSWQYRCKDPKLFAEEVRRALDTTSMKTSYFFDLEFTVSKKRTLAICEELIRQNVSKRLKWCCQTRADTVDDEILDSMKAAGCRLIHYGVESANRKFWRQPTKKPCWK